MFAKKEYFIYIPIARAGPLSNLCHSNMVPAEGGIGLHSTLNGTQCLTEQRETESHDLALLNISETYILLKQDCL